ncbi:hypothetical protein C1H46_040632 [Malus baccata]|uniref:Uncharacterized protein n=1 Tax=Malus baccata TaxID=106549 RepID=A0A540KI20_MALBA|nr:hypothetical protein C1H46_040632 [Malus baccata]
MQKGKKKLQRMIHSGGSQTTTTELLTLCTPSFHTNPPNSGTACRDFMVR